MSEMIERVKAAIAEKFAPAVDMRAPYAKVMLDMAARAAIEAMREPTQQMLDAGAHGSGEDSERTAGGAWESMIDAALGKVDA